MNSRRGFTLLELLIGMTLLGFILALLFSGFRLASTTWDAVETRMERTSQEDMARALVRRLLVQVQPMRWKKAINQPITFVGEAGRLVAVAPLSGQVGSSGLRVIELAAKSAQNSSLSAGTTSTRLVLRQAALNYSGENFSEALATAKEYTLLDALTNIQFDYFGAERKDAQARWHDEWTNSEQLPRLVRVRMASPSGGWSDLIVAPMLTSGGGCNWDAFYKRCR